MDINQLVDDVIERRVDIKTLSTHQLDMLFEQLQELAEESPTDPYQETALELLGVIMDTIDDRIAADSSEGFEEAIAAAEARGSTYWEFETYSVH
jgi:hypothetical protein